MGRRTLLLITSIMVAGIGTILIFLYVDQADGRAEDKAGTVTVLVSSTDIPAGFSMSDAWANGYLMQEQATKATAKDAVAHDFTSLTAKFTHRIERGAIIRQAMFTGPVEATQDHPEFTLGQALVLELAPADRADGLLNPGDRVDVWAIGDGGAEAVARGVEVVTIGTQVNPNMIALNVDDATPKKILAVTTTNAVRLTVRSGVAATTATTPQ